MTKNPSNRTYYSNGKLMITGEYLVLEGALSLSVPLEKGQSLRVKKIDKKPSLSWKTYIQNEYWFEANYSLPDLAIGNANDFPIAQNIREILLEANHLNPDFLNPEYRLEVRSNIEFDINWGFGSSSSLIANIAAWANVDPFELHFRMSEGSGYDIAAAISDLPVLYELRNKQPHFEKVYFYPEFHERIYFGYLGKKRSSAEAVNQFKHSFDNYSDEIDEISAISRRLLNIDNIIDFTMLLQKHDKIISSILNTKPITDKRFPDFNGYVKSLGAWGGDFALFVTDYPKEYLLSYFRKKDIKQWFSYDEIVKSIKPGVNVH